MKLQANTDKLFLILLLFIIFLSSNCKSVHKVQYDEYIEVYYVPFSMSTEGKLFESEVRNLNTPYVSYFCTSEKNILIELKEFVFDTSINPEEKIKDIGPYMVIDFFHKKDAYEKIIIGPSIFFKIRGKVYLMSKKFKDWLSNNIPEATFPVGLRVSRCNTDR